MTLVELIVNMTNLWSYQMNEVDKINEQIAQLTAQRESVMLKEKANVLAKMKEDIKLYGFKTTDFKGILLTRKKRATGTAAKKLEIKKAPK
jgi:hypothetical protein